MILRPAVRIGAGVIGGLLVLLTGSPAAGQTASAPLARGTALPLPTEEWTGDLDQMIKRRFIRVLVAHSKTFFFVDKGTPRGTIYDVMKAFEEH